MSSTESRGGQSSKGFFHWLKNTWLGRLWSRIVNFFKSRRQNTEPQSASEKQKNDGNKNDKSHSSEIEQEKGIESNVLENGEHILVSGPSQTPVNTGSPAMSQSSSEPRSPKNIRNRSKSQTNLNTITSISSDYNDDQILSREDQTLEFAKFSLQLGQKFNSNNTKEENDIYSDFLEVVLSDDADEEHIKGHLQKLTAYPELVGYILNRFSMVSRLIKDGIVNSDKLQSCNVSQPQLQIDDIYSDFLEAVLLDDVDEERIKDHLQKLTAYPELVGYIFNRSSMVSRLIENEIINRGELHSCNASQLHLQERKLD